jgi:hypothetical protein
MTPLSAYVSRLLEGGLERSLPGPVLVVELPRKDGEEPSGDYQFRTASGTGAPDAAAGEPGVLEVTKHKDNAFRRGVTVGRTRNNDLVIDDASVSRFHAWLEKDPGGKGWSVADAGSKNGTRVAGKRLTPKRLVSVSNGERLRFGHIDTVFYEPKAFVDFLRRQMGLAK